MEETEQAELQSYADLVRTNAENSLISAMLANLVKNSPVLDRFSTLLLLGTGATASLFVTNVDKLIPVIGELGFKISGLVLVASGLFGLVAKFRAIQCEMSISNQAMIDLTIPQILGDLDRHHETISTREQQLGVMVDKEFRMDRVISEFFKPMPRIAMFFARRVLLKNEMQPQIAYLLPVRAWLGQGAFTFLQTISFVAFVLATLCYV